MSSQKSTPKIEAATIVVAAEEQAERTGRLKLLAVSGALQGREYLINKASFRIGSGSDNDLEVPDSTVSHSHCRIDVDDKGCLIRDLKSTNGTIVQGIRVTSAHLIPGSEIRLGKTRFIFCPVREADGEVPLSTSEAFGKCLGRSVSMRRLFYLAETYAPSDATVMITGETGTGKEVLAEEIHLHSPRREKAFVVIDCAAISKELIESELFGHVKGAFANANEDRAGAFEIAEGGTVFLDEIGDLAAELQPKLLRVLEKREIRRVGSHEIQKIDVRIVCATNKNLPALVEEEKFRKDLYYRLSGVHLEIPPLRRRRDDVPLFIKQFVTDLHGAEAIEDIADLPRTVEIFKNYEWPGNVRELRNLIELAFYSEHRPVDLSAFLNIGSVRRGSPESDSAFDIEKPFKDAKNELIEKFEKAYLNELLARNRQNISRSARDADIERAYLQRLMTKYGMRESDMREAPPEAP